MDNNILLPRLIKLQELLSDLVETIQNEQKTSELPLPGDQVVVVCDSMDLARTFCRAQGIDFSTVLAVTGNSTSYCLRGRDAKSMFIFLLMDALPDDREALELVKYASDKGARGRQVHGRETLTRLT
jgi:hypothetical protein